MNISPWTIYLWGQLDNIVALCMALTVVSAIACGAMIMAGVVESDFDVEAAKKWRTRGVKALPLAILFGLLAAATPSSNTYAMMVVIPAIANSKAVQRDIPELYDIAIEALKARLKSDITAQPNHQKGGGSE